MFSLAAGTYANPQLLLVTSPTLNAAVYVTQDGTTPTSSSTPAHAGGIEIEASQTVKAIAISGGVSSAVAMVTCTYAPASQTADSAAITHPYGVSVDVSGNVHLADYSDYRVRKVSAATRNIFYDSGKGISGTSGDGGAATSVEVSQLRDVAVDANGNLYLCDFNWVRKVTVAEIITTFAGDSVAGYGSGPTSG